MKKVCLIIILSGISNLLIGQSLYQDFRMKEHFDHNYLKFFQGMAFDPNFTDASGIPKYLFPIDNLTKSKIVYQEYVQNMDGLLDLYLTTKDKAYLYEFMIVAKFIVNNRQDYISSTTSHYPLSPAPPIWFDWRIGSYANVNARVTMPLARFAYLIKDQGISGVPIELNDNIVPTQQRSEFSGAFTFGGFASWLADRVDETLDWCIIQNHSDNMWFTQYCVYNQKYMSGVVPWLPSDPNHGVVLTPINTQTIWGNTFIYMYLYNQSYVDYGNKAEEIANLLTSVNCNQDVINTDGPDVFNAFNGSLRWHYDPFRDYYSNPGQHEDFGHSSWDVIFPILYFQHKNQLPIGNAYVQSDIESFALTFTDVIYDEKFISGIGYKEGFHNCVYGHEGSSASTTNPFNDVDPNCNMTAGINLDFDFPTSRMVGANFAEYIGFEQGTRKIYDILMRMYHNHYRMNISTLGVNNWWSMKTRGFGLMIKEQWQRECVKLELTQRYLYYNQDFVVPNEITIDPNFNSLSDGDLENDYDVNPSAIGYFGLNNEKFIIKEEVISNIISGKNVIIKNGFHAKNGSHVKINVNPELYLCTDSEVRSSENPPNQEQRKASPKKDEIHSDEITDQTLFKVYPNPTNNFIFFEGLTTQLELLEIQNSIGQIVFSTDKQIDYLETTHFKNGVYILKIIQNGKPYLTKIIVQH